MKAVFLRDEVVALVGSGRWLVAVSGGGDSVALLRLLVKAGLAERLVVGTFNHGWGSFGVESAVFVRDLCGELGVEFRVGLGSGKAETNAEAVAREERYAWFGEVCRAENLAGVLVAHTQDDVVETFLMRAGKGSGLGGLAGMKNDAVWNELRVVRPLLVCGREALREYLRGLGQGWMEDPDNVAGGSQRARIRQLMPLLEEAGVRVEGMAASVSALAEAEEVVGRVAEEIPVVWAAGKAEVELARLRQVEVEIGVRVLGRMISELGHAGMVVRRGKRVALWQRMVADDADTATLGGVKFVWRDGKVTATPE